MDFGGFVFTPDAVAGVVGSFVAAGVILGVLSSALAALLAGTDQ